MAKRLKCRLTPKWHEKKFAEMQWIQDLRAIQCPRFRNKLLETGDMILVHNMENDEEWGSGRHNTSLDMQGKIEMETGRKLRSGELKVSQVDNKLNASARPVSPQVPRVLTKGPTTGIVKNQDSKKSKPSTKVKNSSPKASYVSKSTPRQSSMKRLSVTIIENSNAAGMS